MMDLKCDYVVIDVVSQLGTEQNVTSHVQKHSLDSKGVKDRYKGRNKEQNDIILSDVLVTDTIESLHEDGEDAISLDATTLEYAKEENAYVFVDFFASWCSHCKDLAPTWETLAEAMTEAGMEKLDEKLHHDHKNNGHAHPDDISDEEYKEALSVSLPVLIAKIDCVEHKQLCFDQNIWAYPSLRLFIDGKFAGDYKGDRTVLEMIHWLAEVEQAHKANIGEDQFNVKIADQIAREMLEVGETREQMTAIPEKPDKDAEPAEHKAWAANLKKHRTRQTAVDGWNEEEHPGCQINGFLWADRVPGNFHIQARSASHDIAPHMTNVSHEIHHLSFGAPMAMKEMLDGNSANKNMAPKNFEKTLSPLNGNVYVNNNKHEAFHHYLKVVTTNFDDPYRKKRRITDNMPLYQILSSSQLSYYSKDVVPEAKFSYDLSPIAVYHRRDSKKRWYDYITSIMAIIGGAFTLLGMVENTIHAAMSKKKR